MSQNIRITLLAPPTPPIMLVISKMGSQGPAGPSGNSRTSIQSIVVATDANISALPGKSYYLPVATLSTNRNIDLTALNTEGDYVELLNNERVFNWNLTGQLVYNSNGIDTVSALFADTNYMIRLVNGKLRILN